ncbi:hypothetical protein ERJ75_000938400 [Trypanosoma vivax]|uniref:Uncharacterized protein n=1 Tax=Trypanosoma vivax (strain Y486) TaxID=1055687 RepID=G0U496_TRYVY|nr:hypothetical protein TRVL_01251 [Trypanosoma vivax]KAH8611245.1 hypothetical protein ERJ75_000938400 [Trypanosoma vivax]CCC52259.1 conserved hypothetical protein [Trypanosoma vivax Y486]
MEDQLDMMQFTRTGPKVSEKNGGFGELGKLHTPSEHGKFEVSPAEAPVKVCAALGQVSQLSTGGQRAIVCGRVKKLNIMRCAGYGNGAVSPDSQATSSAPPVSKKATESDVTIDAQRFRYAVDILNVMIEEDASRSGMRAWVSRFKNDKAEAKLSKEHLYPVWLIVGSEAILAIDLNGSSQHHNYEAVVATQLDLLPPQGAIILSLQNALFDSQLQLPRSVPELRAMMLPKSTDVRRGSPIGVLFLDPSERWSILYDVCQTYLPSFLRAAYPMGVTLCGDWTAGASPGQGLSHTIEISENIRNSILSSISDSGLPNQNVFVKKGSRLGSVQEQEAVPDHSPDGAENRPRSSVIDVSQLQRHLAGDAMDGHRDVARSPWEERGMESIFTATLFSTSPTLSGKPANAYCRGVLVLTPRGPVQLLAPGPGLMVRVADVAESLLRSCVGRSMRLSRECIAFKYAPSLPPLEDTTLVDTPYSVMRLQISRGV